MSKNVDYTFKVDPLIYTVFDDGTFKVEFNDNLIVDAEISEIYIGDTPIEEFEGEMTPLGDGNNSIYAGLISDDQIKYGGAKPTMSDLRNLPDWPDVYGRKAHAEMLERLEEQKFYTEYDRVLDGIPIIKKSVRAILGPERTDGAVPEPEICVADFEWFDKEVE